MDIKFITKNKRTQKKSGRERKDWLMFQTIMITKWKSHVYKCIQGGCNETFSEITEWRRHAKDSHKLNQYKCDVCGQMTTTMEKHKKHINVHAQKKNKWQCNVCDKTFTNKCYLERHIF